jgi:uncharacterized protein (DUF433 family)
MFNYALDREWIEANPAARIPAPGQERSRDRVLSDDELRELWTALQSLADQEEESDETAQELHRAKARVTPATAEAFQIQLLTAQRPGEVRRMRWADVDLDNGWWSIPGAVAKNTKAHRVPLTKPAVEILERRRQAAAAADDCRGQDGEGRRHAGALAGENGRRSMNYNELIVRDPGIVGGQAVLKGTRVTLNTVLSSLAEGATVAEVLEDFPTLTEEHVRAAIAFAAASAQEDLPVAEVRVKR